MCASWLNRSCLRYINIIICSICLYCMHMCIYKYICIWYAFDLALARKNFLLFRGMPFTRHLFDLDIQILGLQVGLFLLMDHCRISAMRNQVASWIMNHDAHASSWKALGLQTLVRGNLHWASAIWCIQNKRDGKDQPQCWDDSWQNQKWICSI